MGGDTDKEKVVDDIIVRKEVGRRVERKEKGWVKRAKIGRLEMTYWWGYWEEKEVMDDMSWHVSRERCREECREEKEELGGKDQDRSD